MSHIIVINISAEERALIWPEKCLTIFMKYLTSEFSVGK